MKNILLPIDSYGDSRNVLRDVLSHLNGMNGDFRLFVLKTYLVPKAPGHGVISIHDELRDRSLAQLRQEIRSVEKISPDGKIRFEAVAQIGSPANVVRRFVEEKNIDCVILGRDGEIKREDLSPLLPHVSCQVVILPSPLPTHPAAE